MNELQIFKNEEFGEIRTLMIENEPWFVGKDVATVLGYSDPNKAVAMHVDEEDKLNDKSSLSLGQRGGWLINESGLYSLILSSKLESAKKFKRWVTSEVLPSIRKHGLYVTEITIDNIIANPAFGIKLLTQLQEERDEKKKLEREIESMQPKALFADAVSASHTSILVGDLAKLLKQNGVDIGQRRLFERLRKDGFLMKSGSSKNMPTQRAMEQGLFEIKESSYIDSQGNNVITKTSKVTGKGQVFFVNRYMAV